MAPPLLPANYRLVAFDDIDSTNEEAKRRAASGDRGPLWITARTQSEGRGRRGREWVSPAGNLMATLLLAPGAPAPEAACLSFVASLAVHEAVCSWVDPETVSVKWPNDVLVRGRKVSGILLESASNAEGPLLPWLAVGIGINLAHAPAIANYPATYINDHANAPDAQTALSVLAMTWERHFNLWQSEGFEPIRQAWLSVAAGLEEKIEVRLAQETLSGIFESVMHDGALQLRLPTGEKRAITAGEVFFPAKES